MKEKTKFMEKNKPYCNAPHCSHTPNSYCRWEHNCKDYKKGTLNFCSACEYHYEATPLTFWQKLKEFITPQR